MSLPAGTRIGPYDVIALLGSGGMGDVYQARDTRLNRHVAIKFLAEGIADPHAISRFQQEALTASSLNHPHILTVFESGEIDGKQYLAAELVDGGTLKAWVHQETRTWKQIVEMIVGVADGLAVAHAAGILHRDIKRTTSSSRRAAMRSSPTSVSRSWRPRTRIVRAPLRCKARVTA
jgi:serine/threonine protein kinase